MGYPETFQGLDSHDTNNYKHQKKINYKPKPFEDHDVDIKVECCGVCGSDHHIAIGIWGEPMNPAVLGHEIIGKVVRVGPKVNSLKIGDRVGVGAQALSCLKCELCKENNEQYCPHLVWTINREYPDGSKAQGGFGNYVRVHEHFAIPIPKDLPSAEIAPLMCGGITVYSPLVRNGCGPGKNVGIVGIGGIGHMGILIAKAMGANVYAISRTSRKKEDSFKLGADYFIATKEEPEWYKNYSRKLDLIVVCAGSLTDIDFNTLPQVMKIGGRIVSIAIPEAGAKLELDPFVLAGVSISNSGIGSPKEIKQLLELASKKNIRPWVEKVPITEDNLGTVFERMTKGDVRYRFTMVDYDKEFTD